MRSHLGGVEAKSVRVKDGDDGVFVTILGLVWLLVLLLLSKGRSRRLHVGRLGWVGWLAGLAQAMGELLSTPPTNQLYSIPTTTPFKLLEQDLKLG